MAIAPALQSSEKEHLSALQAGPTSVIGHAAACSDGGRREAGQSPVGDRDEIATMEADRANRDKARQADSKLQKQSF